MRLERGSIGTNATAKGRSPAKAGRANRARHRRSRAVAAATLLGAAPIAGSFTALSPRPASAATTVGYANPAAVTDNAVQSTAGSPNLTISTGAYAVGDVIQFSGTSNTSNPFGTTATKYYVVAVNGNTIEVSTTPGGTPINATNTTSTSTAVQGQDWFTASNWTGGVVPNSNSTIANFGSTQGGVPAYVVNGSATIYGLTYNGGGSSDLTLVSGANGNSLYSLTFATNDGTTPVVTLNGTTRIIAFGTTGSGSGNLKLAVAGIQGLIFNSASGGAITGAGTAATSANPLKQIRLANVDWSGFSGGLDIQRGVVQLQAGNQLPAQALTIGDAQTITNNLLAGLNLNNNTASVDALNGNSLGRIFGSGTLTVGSNNGTGTFGGVIGIDFTGAAAATSLIKSGTGTETIPGLIAGSGTVTVNAGTLILSGPNTYTGTTTINGGTLQLGGAGTLGAVTDTLGAIASGAVLDLNGTSQTIAGFTGTSAGQIQNDSGAGVSVLAVTGANPGTFAGVIADNNGSNAGGTVALTLDSTGTLTLTGANTFTGGVKIQAGTLNANGATFTDTLGGVAVTLGDNSVNGNAALSLDGFNTYAENITIAGNAAGGTRSITANGSNNAGQVVKTTGTWTLNSDLTVNVTNASPLRFQGSIGGTGNLTFNAQGSGPADLRGPINNAGTITNAGTGTGGLIFNGTGPGTLGANVTGLIQNSSTGNTTIQSSNPSFAGTVAVNLGSLVLTNASALSASNVVSVASGATLDIQNVNQTIAGLNNVAGASGTVTDSTATAVRTLTLGGSGIYSFGGTITAGNPANMALTTSGTGTYVLTGPSLFTGQTTISAGTLEVDGSLANTPVSVAKGATLAGKGTINNAGANAVTVNGNIAPGTASATGLLTTGTQTWAAGGSYTWRLNTNDPASSSVPSGGTTDPGGAGVNWDMLSMSTLTLPSTGTFTINLTPLSGPGTVAFNPSSSYAWTIADVSTGQGNYANLLANLALYAAPLANATHTSASDYSLGLMSDSGGGSGQDLVVTYTPTPEPTGLTLLGLGAGGLLIRRRRLAMRAVERAI